MEIKRQYLEKYMHDIAIDQLTGEYEAKGYKVSKEAQIDKYRADLMAENGKETIIFEIKTGKMLPEKRERVKDIADYVNNHKGYRFLFVFALPPREKKIDISNLNELFETFLNNEGELDDILNNLPVSHTRLEEITRIDADEISITPKGEFLVNGNGIMEVQWQNGSDGENEGEPPNIEAFPFDFEAILDYDKNKKLEIKEVKHLKVDTSSFDE